MLCTGALMARVYCISAGLKNYIIRFAKSCWEEHTGLGRVHDGGVN